jgi:hypothetical protein
MALCLALATGRVAADETSTQPEPTVAFATPGDKLVSLTVCRGTLCSSVTRTVTVLDPLPAIGAAGATPTAAQQGSLVQLTATATGRPPLTYVWRVLSAAQNVVATFGGASAAWDTTAFPPGAYTAVLAVSNDSGSATSLPIPVGLGPGPFLFADGFEVGTAPWSLAP